MAITGDLDMGNSDLVTAGLRSCLDNTDSNVVVDLEGVPFIDSTGIRVLLRAYIGMRNKGRRLVIATADAVLTRVLTVSGADGALVVFPTVEAAVGDLGAGR